ncbi:4-oxalocrotonate tautomerase family protein [Leptolyngbya sp. NK1-12]|uniref:Tautomerase n=2 Tax=Leptolyngbya sp. NK1-12 TaxID=2547451 RepID=A0AA96WP82_9CYAN|nr:4-oxalocrotonate tautomerase family protein [Leptolyngbya sp. NK1-12]
MPYINIKITREEATSEQKTELIKGVTDLLIRVLNKAPAETFVVIDEVATEDWGIGGVSVQELQRQTQTNQAEKLLKNETLN